ncbi:MAG: uncharacterized protein PWR30_261 [Candidatus Woesearchaeota archaeon]|nr:uncharacterized protein [Candidatus Woesearchaeota archaeon]
MESFVVRVIPNSKEQRLFREGNAIKAYVKARPENGKANQELITLLSEYFDVNKREIKIIKGEKSRNKIIQISSYESNHNQN